MSLACVWHCFISFKTKVCLFLFLSAHTVKSTKSCNSCETFNLEGVGEGEWKGEGDITYLEMWFTEMLNNNIFRNPFCIFLSTFGSGGRGRGKEKPKAKGVFEYTWNLTKFEFLKPYLFLCAVILFVRRALYQPPFWPENVCTTPTVALYMLWKFLENH